ncbi:MAG TPA: dihydrolipoamide acetyltransferase family protein [Thermoanaerobaculia bacterium]|nr:dihydrolipoamide acetyltransferase family protein [Thermoanaerobaculia bacterium]
MYELKLPSLGADMEGAVLSRWLVRPGDRVERGDVVALLETVKSEIEMETFQGGWVERLLVDEGREVPVGTPLALLRTGEEAEGAAAEVRAAEAMPGAVGAPPAAPPPREAPWAPAPLSPAVVPRPLPDAGRARASPAARRRAAELGVELADVPGSGPRGAVLLPDVERAAAAPPSAAEAPPEEAAEAARRRAAAMRGAIAAAMARSKREIPHYYLATTIDLSATLAWLERANLERPVTERLLPAALLLKATALALREAPELNGFWQDGAFRPAGAVHLGVGISVRGGGLVAPALHDADSKSLDELMAALKDLVLRTRAGRLRSSEMTDATVTVTNLGDQGVESVFGIIYPPQVALVGFGKVAERPWAEAGVVAARPAVTATLAADHRASDGHQGARFLTHLGERLQRPEAL